MGIRKRPLAAGLAALVFSSWVSALGLGEITLNSALNEPLDAEIELLNVGGLSESEIIAGLASREDFKKAGVDRELMLSALRFELDFSQAKPVIRVTSQEPIREPYLDFLVDLEWTSGRLLREYTLLLDLPVFSRETPVKKPVSAATASSATTSATASSRTPAVAGGETYAVAGGDTLWSIASRLSGSDSVYQKMAAIQELNPDAFINGNINLLRRGHVLRLPDSAEVAAAQTGGLSQQLRSEDVEDELTKPVWNASPEPVTETTSPSTPQDSPRLSLASSASENGDVLGSENGTGASGSLRGELDTIQEELDRTQRENAELKARLSNLEEQLGTMERMLELGSDDMAAAQVSAGAKVSAGAELSAASDSATGSQSAPEPVTESTQAEEIPAPAATTGMKTASKGWLETLSDYLTYIVGAIVALIAALVFVVIRRNRSEDDETPFMAARQPSRVEPDFPHPDEDDEDDDDEGYQVSSVDEIELQEGDDLFGTEESTVTRVDVGQTAEDLEQDLANFDLGEIDLEKTLPETGEVAFAGDDASATEEDFDSTGELDLGDMAFEDDLAEDALDVGDVGSETPSLDSSNELNLDDLDLLGGADPVATQLELAEAYMGMGDTSGAREILEEVLETGTDAQKEQAQTLLNQLA